MEMNQDAIQGNLESSKGISEIRQFSMANNSHLFNILSNGLYKNKIGAVIQEISCNGIDAHADAGIPDRPIEVHLPTYEDCELRIRDYGKAMSHDMVMDFYSTYGESLKRHTNNQVGGFGLGSKSPFAYSSSFSVTSIHGGRKRIYNCFLLDNGAPGIACIYDEPNDDTEWQSGMEVAVPVKSMDINQFHKNAVNKFRWFRVKPLVDGEPFEVPPFSQDYTVITDTYMIPRHGSTPMVAMGGVAYPVDIANLEYSGLTDLEKSLLQVGIVLFVPLGAVMMAPDRESLQYTDLTYKGLKSALSAVVKSIATEVKAAVVDKEFDTHWERLKHGYEYTKALGSYITSRLADYLIAVGVAPDVAKSLHTEITQRLIKMPTWVGTGMRDLTMFSGKDGIEIPQLKDVLAKLKAIDDKEVFLFNEAQPEEDIEKELEANTNNLPILSMKSHEELKAIQSILEGCRVFMYSESSQRSNAVSRKEVVRGTHPGTHRNIEVNLAVTEDYVIVVSEKNNADDRARAYVSKTGKNVILIQPLVRIEGSNDVALNTVKKLKEVPGFDGLDVVMSSTLPDSDKAKERKVAKKEKRVVSPMVAYGKDHAIIYNVSKKTYEMTEIADLQAVAVDKIAYIMATSSYTRRTYIYHTQIRVTNPLTGANVDIRLSNSDEVSAFLALNSFITGVSFEYIVVVPDEAKLKRWKLDKANIVKLDDKLVELVTADPSLITKNYAKTSVKEWDISPDQYTMRNSESLIPALIYAAYTDIDRSKRGVVDTQWNALFEKFPDHPAIAKTLELLASYYDFSSKKSAVGSSLDVTNYTSVVNYLAKRNVMSLVDADDASVITVDSLNELSSKEFPGSDLIVWDSLRDRERLVEGFSFYVKATTEDASTAQPQSSPNNVIVLKKASKVA